MCKLFLPETTGTDPNKSRSEKNQMRSGKNRIVPENIQTINGDNSWVPSSVNGIRCIVLTGGNAKPFGPECFQKKVSNFHAPSSSLPLHFPPKLKELKKNLKPITSPWKQTHTTTSSSSIISFATPLGFDVCYIAKTLIIERGECVSDPISNSFFVIRISSSIGTIH